MDYLPIYISDNTEALLMKSGSTDKLDNLTLVFNSSNYNSAQVVTVIGQKDYEIGDTSYNVMLMPTTSDDTQYNGVNPQDLSFVNIADDSIVLFDLGTPQFLGVLNDELATKFVSRETGWFRVADKTLYLAAQALGEPKLKTAACKKGALQTAGESGTEIVSRITNLLRAHDDDRTVRVVFTPIRCK